MRRDTAGRLPMAGGEPLDPAVAEAAAHWLTLLMSGEASDADRQRWRSWRAAHADHERAWQHLERVCGRLKAVEPRSAYRVLSRRRTPGDAPDTLRRSTLRTLVCGGAAASAVWLWQTPTAQRLAADHRSAAGERRALELADGTRLLLGSASAVDLHFDADHRRVRLLAGEILVTTGHRRDEVRPFLVETRDGRVRALGTRFFVRLDDTRTRVAVLESAVEISPDRGDGPPVRLTAGQQAVFDRSAVGTPRPLDESALAWTRGQIVADDMRLDEFLAELSRYRAGVVRCAPRAAALRVSGVFPLDDTTLILTTLPHVLPVRLQWRTRYWVSVEPGD